MPHVPKRSRAPRFTKVKVISRLLDASLLALGLYASVYSVAWMWRTFTFFVLVLVVLTLLTVCLLTDNQGRLKDDKVDTLAQLGKVNMSLAAVLDVGVTLTLVIGGKWGAYLLALCWVFVHYCAYMLYLQALRLRAEEAQA